MIAPPTDLDLPSVLRRNRDLDAELLALATHITPDTLHASQGAGRWTLAEQLGHIAEFPVFFAQDLADWLAHGGPVGRTHAHPARLAAVEGARTVSLDELVGRLTPAFEALARALAVLTPDQLASMMENRKYGREPFANYLARYILGHKAGHVRQLRRSLDYLTGGRIQLDGYVPIPADVAERYRREGLWRGRTLGELFDEVAARSGSAPALNGTDVDGVERRLTYLDLQQRANNLAAGLYAEGITLGSRVVVQLPNVPGFVTLMLALFKIGALPVLALPPHREHEIGHMIEHAGATAYAVPRTWRGSDGLAMARTLRKQHAGLTHILVSGRDGDEGGDQDVVSLDRLEQTAALSADMPAPVASDVALFLLSGGTTGVPKLIPRTHDDYALNLRESARVCALDAQTVYLVVLPAAHNFPLGCPGILGTLSAGGRVVMCPSPDADSALGLIEREAVTTTAVVPAVAILWMESPGLGRRNLSSLSLLQVGGQRLQPQHARLVRPQLKCAVLQQVFGMAEGLLNFTRLDDPDSVVLETQGRPLLPDDEIRVVDDDDVQVADGQAGQLLTRGPYTIRGYFRAPEHNSRSFTPDGFYRTGDIVRFQQGNFVVEGRIKDVINRGGEKISAEEVERLILEHSAVVSAAVVAMPDRVLGERICAYVVTRGGTTLAAHDLGEFLLAKGLAKFKLPERVEILPELPLTNVGKVDKQVLRERLQRGAVSNTLPRDRA